ncbi:LamG-like jellyroll fold domain-containing protein, partial [Roseibium hamelinense]
TPVFAIAGDLEMDGKRGSEFATAHTDGMALDEGTIAFSFKADEITGRDALFSKDAKSYVDGGHLTAWVKSNGDVHIRFQTSEKSYWLKAEDVVSAGTEHHFAFSFGDHGAILYIDGTEVARNDALTQNWLANREVLVIGANDYTSQTGELGRTRDHFDGVISNFAVLDQQLTGLGAQALADIDAIV